MMTYTRTRFFVFLIISGVSVVFLLCLCAFSKRGRTQVVSRKLEKPLDNSVPGVCVLSRPEVAQGSQVQQYLFGKGEFVT